MKFFPRLSGRYGTNSPKCPENSCSTGGAALALHLAHRNSVDFDLFGSRSLDLSQIEQGTSFLKGANIIQRDKNTLSAIVDRGGPVKVSFFGVPNLPRLSAAVVARDNGLGVASLLDLAGTLACAEAMVSNSPGAMSSNDGPGQIRCDADQAVGHHADDPQRALRIEGHAIGESAFRESEPERIGQPDQCRAGADCRRRRRWMFSAGWRRR